MPLPGARDEICRWRRCWKLAVWARVLKSSLKFFSSLMKSIESPSSRNFSLVLIYKIYDSTDSLQTSFGSIAHYINFSFFISCFFFQGKIYCKIAKWKESFRKEFHAVVSDSLRERVFDSLSSNKAKLSLGWCLNPLLQVQKLCPYWTFITI